MASTSSGSGLRRSGPVRFATADRFGRPVLVDASTSDGGAICPQPPSRLANVMGPQPGERRQDEDCLFLSLVGPSSPGPHPVMVFVHGGGFVSGSGLVPWYDGGRLAAEQDVVVVSISYRLSAFGYLCLDGISQGNLGLLDQAMALRWVHDHIAEWGGDPDAITMFGQSAGAGSISWLLEDPSSRALIRRAVLHSGPLPAMETTPAEAALDAEAFLDALGTDPRTAPPDDVIAAAGAAARAHRERTGDRVEPPFVAVRGRSGLTESFTPAVAADSLDLLIGWNRDDPSAFGLGVDATGRLLAEPWAERGAALTRAGARVTGYRLDWRPAGSPFGATHCLELPLLLGDEAAWRDVPLLGTTPWAETDRLGRQWRAVWGHFARTGETDPTLAPDVPATWCGPDLTDLAERL